MPVHEVYPAVIVEREPVVSPVERVKFRAGGEWATIERLHDGALRATISGPQGRPKMWDHISPKAAGALRDALVAMTAERPC